MKIFLCMACPGVVQLTNKEKIGGVISVLPETFLCDVFVLREIRTCAALQKCSSRFKSRYSGLWRPVLL